MWGCLVPAYNQGELPPRSIADGQETLSRRTLVWRGIQGALKFALMASGAEALLNTAEGSGFILSAPHYEDRAACHTVAHFGNIGELVNIQACAYADVGDSIARGCNDYNWAWAGPAQLLTENMNLTLAAAGVPRPQRSRNDRSPYLQSIMLARGGSTIGEIRGQVARLNMLEADSSEQMDVPLVVMSAGGNNAIQFLLRNLVPTLLGGFVTMFKAGFMPQFEREYRPLLAELVAQREASPTANPHVFILGVTDIGKSRLIPPLRIWGISQLATATCRYINDKILDVMEDLQPHTRVQMHFVDIFTDRYGNPITLGGIHPTRPEYAQIVEKIMDRCTADFPNGFNTFRQEQVDEGIRPRIAT